MAKRIKVQISESEDETREVSGYLLVPGVGVHKGWLGRSWTITHLQSGKSLAHGLPTRKAAEAVFQAVQADVPSWDVSEDVLSAAMPAGAYGRIRDARLAIGAGLGY